RLEIVAAGLPLFLALRERGFGELDRDRSLLGVDRDDVAVLQEPDRPAHRRPGPHRPAAEAAGRPREPAGRTPGPRVAHAPASGRLGPDVPDAEAAGRSGEPAVGNQGHLVAHALAIDRGRGREHLAHAGAAARSFVADHQHLADLVVPLLDGGEAVLLALEDA